VDNGGCLILRSSSLFSFDREYFALRVFGEYLMPFFTVFFIGSFALLFIFGSLVGAF
jgi:hypothetical protein